MLNGRYCGNCKHWKDAVPTARGRVPYKGRCAMGYPLKAGQKTARGVVATFKVRTDSCKCWERLRQEKAE